MPRRRVAEVSRRTLLAASGAATSMALAAAVFAVRRAPPALLVDDFIEAGDRDDAAPALTRAFAAGLAQRRSLQLAQGRTYSLRSAVEIENRDGWTPVLFGNGARIDILTEAAGFRYRGVKSGQRANPAEGGIRDLTIDANLIAVSNGVWAITVENGGGLVFEAVEGINFRQGYGVLNFRYADGGAPVGGVTVRDCRFSGSVLERTADPKWYGFSDTGDLSSVKPGDEVPDGASRAIATVETGRNGAGMPRFAKVLHWSNRTGRPVTVPASLTESSLAGAGLTKGPASLSLNGATVSPVFFDYYSSGGTLLPDCVVPAAGGTLENYECHGSYYSAYLSGVASYTIRGYRSDLAIRGLAAEWGARRISVDDIRVRESLSSAWLFGYNCPDCSVTNFRVEELTSRWVGEALSNVQLSAPRFVLGRGSMVTRDNVTNGQYFIKASVDCSDFRVEGPVHLRGDCRKAYVCIESAYNSAVARSNPEHYPQSRIYDGGASRDMSGIRLRNIRIDAVTVKPEAATALCLMQVADAVHGEIGLSDIVIENFHAGSPKHVHHLKLYEGVDVRRQINGIRMRDVEIPALANGLAPAGRLVLPRRRSHFIEVHNVTGMDEVL